MGYIDLSEVTLTLPDGRRLLDTVSLRVDRGATTGVVGPNGGGKTTLLRLLAGEITPDEGEIRVTGGVGLMPQFIGSVRDDSSVRDLLLSAAPARIRAGTAALRAAEGDLAEREDEQAQMNYAAALSEHIEAGGYELEVVWDACTTIALGLPLEQVADRPVTTLSGGEQKALVLQVLLRGPDDVLLLDEPDNYLDVGAKQWLEQELRASTKTILLVSHDRQLLANGAEQILTVEDRDLWLHNGGFATYAEARHARLERISERRRQWEREHRRLTSVVQTLRHSAATHDTVKSARSRLKRFEEAGPPRRPPKRQNVRMRLRGGRTGKRALSMQELELTGLTKPFSAEVWFGERVAVLGANGTGKTHLLTLLKEAAGPQTTIPHRGEVTLGARVLPGLFTQTHTRPDLLERTPADIVMSDCGMERNDAMTALARYEIAPAWNQPFHTLSGGQQARLQILLLELAGSTLLLLDEPTDNLDLASAAALQQGLAEFSGTVLAVTHDRWFAEDFDRYFHFRPDGTVEDVLSPVWADDTR
jgi:ATPase subunit of ABC transporter with duplicated ATPase domains